jgi:hypothetical protein
MINAPEDDQPRRNRRAWWLVALVLVASRLVVFFLASPISGLYPYYLWVQEFQAAVTHGVDFYTYHEQRAQQQIDQRRRQGRGDLHEESRYLEYPPLALVAILLPGAVVGPLPEDEPFPDDQMWRYVTAYRLEMLLFDLLAFAVVAVMMRRLYPEETPAEQAERLIVYLLATAALGPLLYNRLDIAMAGLVVLALALLVCGATFWSMLVLALAIHFKLIPLVLTPWWALGTCAANWPKRPVTFARFVLPPLERLVLLAALVVALFIPFWLLGGARTLGFLAFHQERGVEVESTYGVLLMALRPFGYPIEVIERHGAFDLISPLSPGCVHLAGVVAAALLTVAGGLLLWALLRRPQEDARETTPARTLAQAHPRLFVAHTLLVLMLVVAANKVFSPQYLLWLAPLVALAPFARRSRRVLMWSFVGLCLLTTLIFPILFYKHIVGLVSPVTVPPCFNGPTTLGLVVLGARNLLLLVLVIWTLLLVRSASDGSGRRLASARG